MNKENITSAEYIYDLQNIKSMVKVIANEIVYWIPNECPENRDYRTLMEWVQDGNTIIDNPPE